MSSTQKQNHVIMSEVVVRAFEDEPVHLQARSMADGVVEVIGTDPNVPGYFPESSVYCFDAVLYQDLRSAWEEKKAKELQSLWSKSRKWELKKAS